MSSAREVIETVLVPYLPRSEQNRVAATDAILSAIDVAGKKIVDTAEWEELSAFRTSLEEAAQWLSEHDAAAAGSGE